MRKNIKNMVKVDSRFNRTCLSDMDVREQDILFSICSSFTQRQTGSIIIPLDEFRKLAKLTKAEAKVNEARFRVILESAIDKAMKLTFAVDVEEPEKGKSTDYFSMFSRFKAYWDENELRVTLNPCFHHYFYDIPEKVSFTLYELEMILKLRSIYSKTLFRLFRQNFKGSFTMPYSEFKARMGLAEKKYPTTNIVKLINKSIEELKTCHIYKEVTFTPTWGTGRGHPLEAVTFTYTLDDEANSILGGTSKILQSDPEYVYKTTKEVSLVTDPKTHVIRGIQKEKAAPEKELCPSCGNPLVYRVIGSGKYEGRKAKCCINHVFKNQKWECEYIDWASLKNPQDTSESEKKKTEKLSTQDPFPEE